MVICAYHREKFLVPAIESNLNQTFRDFELIVVVDWSTILREFKDERIRIIRNERNLGVAETTNRGLAAARGEYIALQDQDDLSWPNRFERQVALDCHPEVGMVGSSCNIMNEAGTVSPENVEAVAAAIRRAINDSSLVEFAADTNTRIADERLDRERICREVVSLYTRVAS